MNNSFKKDISKSLKNSDLGGAKELSPGSTGRRYTPSLGTKKHNERIHKESKDLDKYKNLPFSFSKPNKPKLQKLVRCETCGTLKWVNKNTVGTICSNCKIYTGVKEVNSD